MITKYTKGKAVKVLTKVALGGLVNRPPQNVELHLEDKHKEYLSTQFIGESDVWDSEYMHYKHGLPSIVTEWLQGFGIDKSFDSDFVIASVIDLVMKFRSEGEEKFFEKDGSVYKRALHRSAKETQHSDLFKIPLRGDEVRWGEPSKLLGYAEHEDLCLYISRNAQDTSVFENPISENEDMILHVPYVEANFEEVISEFEGMSCSYDGKEAKIGEAGVITMFKMDAKGAEAKQAAYMGMLSACAMIPKTKRHPRVEVIDSNFFVYITVKSKLAFAIEVEPSDFVEGQGVPEHFESKDSWVEDLTKAKKHWG